MDVHKTPSLVSIIYPIISRPDGTTSVQYFKLEDGAVRPDTHLVSLVLHTSPRVPVRDPNQQKGKIYGYEVDKSQLQKTIII